MMRIYKSDSERGVSAAGRQGCDMGHIEQIRKLVVKKSAGGGIRERMSR